MSGPDLKAIRELIRYEAETGAFFWLPRSAHHFSSARAAASWNAKFAGKQTMKSPNMHGYTQATIRGVKVAAHRLAWALSHDEWPVEEIDHIDGIRTNNRLANLRTATSSQNKRNQGISRRNRSGVKGVCVGKKVGEWRAVIFANGKQVYLGGFRNISDAESAVRAARIALHGDFARHS